MSAIPPTPAERFAQIIAMMVGMIGARLERPGKPGLAGPLTMAIHLRLQRIRNRIARYVERFRAGTLTPPRQRAAGPRRRTAPAKPSPWAWANLPELPRSRMWLTRLVPGIIVGANHLKILLDEPEMRAMLETAPQIGRTLRPFWHMLSPDPLPPLLRKPPKPESAPAPSPGAACPVGLLRSPTPKSGLSREAGQRRGQGTPSPRPAPQHRPPAPEVAVSPIVLPAPG